MTRPPLLLILMLASSLAGPLPAYAHGTERHFGTPINGRGAASATGGSPAFTLLALAVTLVVIGSRRPSRDEVVRAKGKPPAQAPVQGGGR